MCDREGCVVRIYCVVHKSVHTSVHKSVVYLETCGMVYCVMQIYMS